jgi:hypothetical protein
MYNYIRISVCVFLSANIYLYMGLRIEEGFIEAEDVFIISLFMYQRECNEEVKKKKMEER